MFFYSLYNTPTVNPFHTHTHTPLAPANPSHYDYDFFERHSVGGINYVAGVWRVCPPGVCVCVCGVCVCVVCVCVRGVCAVHRRHTHTHTHTHTSANRELLQQQS